MVTHPGPLASGQVPASLGLEAASMAFNCKVTRVGQACASLMRCLGAGVGLALSGWLQLISLTLSGD